LLQTAVTAINDTTAALTAKGDLYIQLMRLRETWGRLSRADRLWAAEAVALFLLNREQAAAD